MAQRLQCRLQDLLRPPLGFVLLLLVYAHGYLGLIFSWVLLALGLLAWCHLSLSLKVSHLCCALALLENRDSAMCF